MPEMIPCTHCGHKVSSEAISRVGGKPVCPRCVEIAERASQAERLSVGVSRSWRLLAIGGLAFGALVLLLAVLYRPTPKMVEVTREVKVVDPQMQAELDVLRITGRAELERLKAENAKLAEETQKLQAQLKEARSSRPVEASVPPVPLPTGTEVPKPPSVTPQPGPELGKWEGFRGLKWRTSITDAPGMVLVEGKGDQKIYRRDGDKLTWGDAQLTRVAYCFYKGRFGGWIVEAEGMSNLAALKDAAFAMYGEGYQADKSIQTWTWADKDGVGDKDVSMKLQLSATAKQAHLAALHRSMYDEQQADTAKNAIRVQVLCAEYDKNEVAADEKYKGKTVIVNGVIEKIGKDILGQAYILITGGELLKGVQCTFPKERHESVARRVKGETVFIKGTITGKMIWVQMENCSVE